MFVESTVGVEIFEMDKIEVDVGISALGSVRLFPKSPKFWGENLGESFGFRVQNLG